MEINELRQKNEEELKSLVEDGEKELQELRIEHRTEGLVDTSELKKKRKDIARVKTVLREKEILEEIK
jgi:large subunit ribosomal protein L29